MALYGGDRVKIAVARGQQPEPRVNGRYNLPMNPTETVRARQNVDKLEAGCTRVEPAYTDVGMLNIDPWDIVLGPIITPEGLPAIPELEQAPFSALNGMRKRYGPILEQYDFKGVAMKGYTFGPLQANRELAVAIAGQVPFVNVCGMIIRDGMGLTISVDHDDITIDPSYALSGAGRAHFSQAAETNKILKPFFAPAGGVFMGKVVARACGTIKPNEWGSVMLCISP